MAPVKSCYIARSSIDATYTELVVINVVIWLYTDSRESVYNLYTSKAYFFKKYYSVQFYQEQYRSILLVEFSEEFSNVFLPHKFLINGQWCWLTTLASLEREASVTHQSFSFLWTRLHWITYLHARSKCLESSVYAWFMKYPYIMLVLYKLVLQKSKFT